MSKTVPPRVDDEIIPLIEFLRRAVPLQKSDAAEKLGWIKQKYNNVCKNKRGLSPEMIIEVGNAWGISNKQLKELTGYWYGTYYLDLCNDEELDAADGSKSRRKSVSARE